MTTATYANFINGLYVVMYGRVADATGYSYWLGTQGVSSQDAVTLAIPAAAEQSIAKSFLTTQSSYFDAQYGITSQTGAKLSDTDFILKLYNNLGGNTDGVSGSDLAYWQAQLVSVGGDRAALAAKFTDAFITYNGPDVAGLGRQASFMNSVAVSQAWVSTSATNPFMNSTSTTDAAFAAEQAILTGMNATPAALTAALGQISGAASSGSLTGVIGSPGGNTNTFTLTTGVDSLKGTTGNDTFIADNTAGPGKYTLTAADSINDPNGVNTLKIYSDATAAGVTFTANQLTGLTNLFVNNIGATPLDVTGISGLKNVTLDAPAGSQTLTVAGQSVTYSNEATGGYTFTVASTTDTAESVTFNAVGIKAAHDTLDINGALVTSAAIASTGSANFVDLTNTGGALASLTISGNQALTMVESINGLKTINASSSTGAVSVDASGATIATSFAFTGGAGNDSLTLKAGALASLNSGSQLDGGAGTADTLVVKDVTANITTGWYSAVNAVKNFEVLGFAGGAATAVDVSKITAAFAGHFADNAAGTNLALTNVGNNFILDENAATTNSFSMAVGANTVTINEAGGIGAHTDTITGVSTLNLTTGTKGGADTITFVNSDNTTFNISGSQGLTLAISAAATTGDKIDAHTLTGAFTTGTSGKGDIILTGSAASTITEATGTESNTITYLSGHTTVDTLKILQATGGNNTDVVNNYVLGQDIIKGNTAALVVGSELGAASGVVASGSYATAAAFVTAAEAFATATAKDTVVWYDSANNNTYVAEWTAAATNSAHIIELVGVHATAVGLTSSAGSVVIA